MQPAIRPLSPHLQVYRPQLTALLSIAHRGSGVLLAVGSLLLPWWFVSIAGGAQSFADAQAFFGGFIGRTLLLLWSLALFYHLCNGIRHLAWDVGFGFEIKSVYRSGWMVIVAALVLTAFAWIVGYSMRGGV